MEESYLLPLKSYLLTEIENAQVHIVNIPRHLPPSEYIKHISKKYKDPGLWIGHSFGCQLIEELVSSHSQLVLSVALIAPPEIKGSIISQLARIIYDGFYEPYRLIFHALKSVFRLGYHKAKQEAKWSKKLWKKQTSSIKKPLIVIHGGRDKFTSLHVAKELADRHDGELFYISQAAHGSVYSHPEKIAKIIATEIVS